jgi:hypothetical protein
MPKPISSDHTGTNSRGAHCLDGEHLNSVLVSLCHAASGPDIEGDEYLELLTQAPASQSECCPSIVSPQGRWDESQLQPPQDGNSENMPTGTRESDATRSLTFALPGFPQ